MNIFVLDRTPYLSAWALSDVHVNKMVVESMQMLTTALHQTGVLRADQLPFRADGKTRYSGNAHVHHPCTKWVMEGLDKPTMTIRAGTPNETEIKSVDWHIWELFDEMGIDKTKYSTNVITINAPNYCWLWRYTNTLFHEYNHRFGKTHGCREAFDKLPKSDEGNDSFVTDFVQAMPDEFKVEGDPVKAYRQYYHTKPASFKRKKVEWVRGREAPDWWMQQLADYIKAVSA
tara:strand:+ start:776 stop:1468 length:693 start_codon:yes stop_codon:yes gene_type:complete